MGPSDRIEQIGSVAFAIEARLKELRWQIARSNIAGNGIAWELFVSGGKVNVVVVMNNGYLEIHHNHKSRSYELADPKSFQEFEERLGCLLNRAIASATINQAVSYLTN